jgi:hypothetical protein
MARRRAITTFGPATKGKRFYARDNSDQVDWRFRAGEMSR